MINSIFETTPSYVNSIGTKWWVDSEINSYITQFIKDNPILGDIKGWCVEHQDGVRERVLVKNMQIIYSSPQLESICAHIDMIKLSLQHLG